MSITLDYPIFNNAFFTMQIYLHLSDM